MGDEEVKSDVQDMNKAFGYEAAEEEVVEETADEPVEEKEDEPEDETEEAEITEESEEESTEEESTERDSEEEAEDQETEEDEKDKIIADLRKRLDEKEEPEAKPEPEPEQAEQPLQFESQPFIDEDDDLEDLIRDPEKLNDLFNNIYQRAVTDTRKVLGEGILRTIPDIVRSSVDVMDKLKQMSTKFYTDNKDLEPFKKVVATVFEEVASNNPGKDMMELLPLVSKESRKRLDLHKKATQPSNRKSPRLPRRKQRTTLNEDKPDTNPLLNELSEMNKILRR